MIRALVRVIRNAFIVAAVAVAAQLAVAQALSIIRWDQTYQSDNTHAWSALLTWIAFVYAVAVLSGATVGRRAAATSPRPESIIPRIVAVLAAMLGGAGGVTVAWLFAQDIRPPVGVDPSLVVSLTAGAGVLAGGLIALLTTSAAPIAGSVSAAVIWVWSAGIGCAAVGIAADRPFDTPRLAVLDAPSVIPSTTWTGPNIMIQIAAALGLIIAAIARWRGASRWSIALSGCAGPAVVAAAYLIAGPGLDPHRWTQFEPYRAALISVGVGLIGAVLVATPGRLVAEDGEQAVAPAVTEQPDEEDNDLFGQLSYGESDENDESGYDSREPYEPDQSYEATYGPGLYPPQSTYEPADDGMRYGSIDPTRRRGAPIADQTPHYPGAAPPAPPMLGQPSRSKDEDYSNWLRGLGPTNE